MPNLLKSLPREILEQEDTKFIYNVLNPLLFEKIPESSVITRNSHTVEELLLNDINTDVSKINQFNIPFNIDSREFHVYMEDGQNKTKIERFSDTTLVNDLDDIKDYIFHYFGTEDYKFLQPFMEKFYYLKSEVAKNKRLYDSNYKKFLTVIDIKQKQILKQTYLYFQNEFNTYNDLFQEFEIVLSELNNYAQYSINQLMDNIAKSLASKLSIKSFDNEIIFSKSKIFVYLTNNIEYDETVKLHQFIGKKINSTSEFTPNNIFELMSIFAMELATIQIKYDDYLMLLINNGDNGYALTKSDVKKLKNTIYENIKIDLDSDNLTYFLNEEDNTLELYMYFDKAFRVDETTISLSINDHTIPASIISLTGKINSGYTIFNYIDDTTKYYKITVHDYLVKDLEGVYTNYDIEDILLEFTAIESSTDLIVPTSPILETTGFIDNFIIYKKSSNGFYEEMKIPFKVRIMIDEKEERYTRMYEFMGIDNESHIDLITQEEILISYCSYDYVYTPKIYVDFFGAKQNTVNFRYQTLLQYVLIDDVMGKDFEINYFEFINPSNDEYNTNIKKNILMDSGKVYRKLYDEKNQMVLMNPYNEPNVEYVNRVSFSQYEERPHTRETLIKSKIEKIPFYSNLKFLDKFQYDKKRDAMIFLYRGFQYIVPVAETLMRNKHFEQLSYDKHTSKIYYCGKEMCETGFMFADEKIYVPNPLTHEIDLLDLVPVMSINITNQNDVIFYDAFNVCHSIIIDNIQYKIDNIYVATLEEVIAYNTPTFYIESKYGIPRYKNAAGEIFDVNIYNSDIESEGGYIDYDAEAKSMVYKNADETFEFQLSELKKKTSLHRLVGMNSYSIFYAGNTLPENSNKQFFGRENIYSSMMIPDNIYSIGRSEDNINDSQQHRLLGEQLDLNIDNASKYNKEVESFIMSKTATASLKGLESYLKSNLKSISQDINVSPVYLVQRNRFISEWAKVSTVLPTNDFAEESLRGLVADLMETRLIQGKYDDLIDIFKANEFEKFSLDTNNINNVLILYIQRYLEEAYLQEDFDYYLIHSVWMKNKRKSMTDFINKTADDYTIKILSQMTFETDLEREQYFYMFIKELEKESKETIEVYKPIANYSDWIDVQENNHIHFEKPFKYEVIDISNFIDLPIEWDLPLLMIRPLVDDGVFLKRDYRFLDTSMITNSLISNIDLYNEFLVSKEAKLNKTIDYTYLTLQVLQELSLTGNYDYLSINFVIIKWIVERFLPNYVLSNDVETVEDIKTVVKTEILSAEHPNMIVDYNRIKENTLLTDLGSSIDEIYETIRDGDLLLNSVIELEVSDEIELSYLDKIKKPVEHYFDYLFTSKRHDIITKVLALFTEDVIASSMLDLSLAINIKNTNGDETFDIYEKMINELFDDFLPFHTVLDKILFSIKIMETSSIEAVSKQADVEVLDLNYIDIVSTYSEKIRIQTLDSSIVTTKVNILFPSEGAKSCRDYELPHDYNRSIKMAGHSMFEHGMEDVGMDDEWYIDEDNYSRSLEVYTPPAFSDNHWMCIPESDYEQITDVYITEYYHIKEDIFNKDDRIESHFIDFVPTIEITQGITEKAEVDLTEDYLIAIDATFNIRFYDMENIGHDEYGLDEYAGPEDQTTLIGMKESFMQNIMHDFYDKLNIMASDSVWTDIKVVHDLLAVPGHDEFGVDEYYHQQHPDNLGQDMSVMVYDELLHQGFNTHVVDMTDVSLVDKVLAKVIASTIEAKATIEVADTLHTTIEIVGGRTNNGRYVLDGAFIQAGHEEFLHDEYYHNSTEWERLANMVDTLLMDFLGDIRIDFGFMRMLPTDPYQDLIDQKFYRVDQPGSEVQTSRIRDKFTTNIHTFGKDFIRANMLDVTNISIISEDIRRTIYNGIEEEEIGGDLFDVQFVDSLTTRHIHHDFREHIVALDKYASILDDAAILEIFGTRAANIERDELFELRLGDSLVTDIKIKRPVDRVMTRIDKDYLKSIKIEEEDFVSFKYVDKELSVRFAENLRTYYLFNEKSTIVLTELEKQNIHSIDKDETDVSLVEKLHYGNRHTFEIDGMQLGTSDTLIEMWNNKIYTDSMVMSITDSTEITEVAHNYNFGEERTSQEHDMYGHMGYTDDSIDRTIESKLSDSLVTRLNFENKETIYTEVYDSLMRNVDFYFGEATSVVISDSLETYINIVKRPWIWPEFDDFGHNENPHMYHGEDDEFGITTQLKDRLKMDADTFLYNVGALVTTSERITVTLNQEPIKDDTISASMVDDLKVISLGFKDTIHVINTDHQTITKKIDETPINIVISDTVWYGYKLQEDRNTTYVEDNLLDYGYEDSILRDVTVRAKIQDWLLFKLNFDEGRVQVDLSDDNMVLNTNLYYGDELGISISDTLEIHESTGYIYSDTMSVNLSDSISMMSNEIDTSDVSKDVIGVNINETLSYGPGKWFNDKVRGYIQNRMSIYEEQEQGPKLDITMDDNFHMYADTATFYDKLGVQTYERLKYGLIFKDKLNISILRDNDLRIERSWFVNRFGVDEVIHDDIMMEWEDDSSVENTTTTELFDDIVVIDTHLQFIDRLDILSQENMAVSDEIISAKDGIIITSSDNLMYGVGLYDYIWDAKEWENYGYEVPYEKWDGLVPHDEFPYDAMEHEQQGEDLSQITTGVTENLLYGFDHFFKDSISVQTQDSGGFSTWGYQSVFKETMSVWVENRLMSSYADTDDKLVDIQVRKEQMNISYDFEDKTKTHLFTEENGIAKEEINIYDVETQQLLESVFKYRIYEKIDVEINQNLLTSALFKFDDEMSLITDYNTKIDLYKEKPDGSIAKSMTVIKDSTSSNVTLFFGDFINATASDYIQGTEATRPDEYLD